MRIRALTSFAGPDGTFVPGETVEVSDVLGESWVAAGLAEEVKSVVIDASTVDNTEIVAAVANRRVCITSFFLVAAGAVVAKFQSGTSDISGPMSLSSQGGVSARDNRGLFLTATGEALNINLDTAVQVGGSLSYAIREV